MLSIVIPTLNEEKYLQVLLLSLEKQTYKDFEVIVADNNSRDNTMQVALASNCKVVPGGLPAAGRNSGALHSSHDLLFLDSDVELDHNFLERFWDLTLGCDVATCLVAPKHNCFSHKLYYTIKNYGNIFIGYLAPHASGQCLFIKKGLFQELGGYDETLYLAEEHDIVQRAVRQGARFRFLNLSIKDSGRRLSSEGFFRLIAKGAISELHRLLIGKIRYKIFEYKYGEFTPQKSTEELSRDSPYSYDGRSEA